MRVIQVLSERRYKAGYVVRRELHDAHMEPPESPTMEMRVAYTLDGHYIGEPWRAYRLCKKWGIKPELLTPTSSVCSIGFSERDQKWYGWSHRALYGFKVGDAVEEGDLTATSGMTEEGDKLFPEDNHSLPVGYRASTQQDARRMAEAFAAAVS